MGPPLVFEAASLLGWPEDFRFRLGFVAAWVGRGVSAALRACSRRPVAQRLDHSME